MLRYTSVAILFVTWVDSTEQTRAEKAVQAMQAGWIRLAERVSKEGREARQAGSAVLRALVRSLGMLRVLKHVPLEHNAKCFQRPRVFYAMMRIDKKHKPRVRASRKNVVICCEMYLHPSNYGNMS